MTTKKTKTPRDGWEAAAQTRHVFAPQTQAGERQRRARLKAAEMLIRMNGLREAYRLASTENSVVGVGLVHLSRGGSPASVASGLTEWVATHPKPGSKPRKRDGSGRFS